MAELSSWFSGLRPVYVLGWLVASSLALGACADRPAALDSAPPRAPVEANVSVDPAVATTGDQITYRVELSYLEGYQVDLPDPGAQIAGFRIVDIGRDPLRTTGGRVFENRWYRLRADLVGSYILPPLRVEYLAPDGEEESLETSEIFVEVESVLPEEGAATDIRDVKPLRRPEARAPWLPWTVAAIVALAGLGWWRWRRRRGSPLVAAGLPPHEVAFRQLDRLRKVDFGDLEELRAYYFEISEVLRTYIEARFGLNATDLTSEEILSRVDWLSRLGREDVSRLQRFLDLTDRVKYAAEVPNEREIEESYDAALDFVESTRPHEESELAETEGGVEELRAAGETAEATEPVAVGAADGGSQRAAGGG